MKGLRKPMGILDSEPHEPWELRREIKSFSLSEEEVDQIIHTASHAVVSWVTKSNEPVTAVMLYTVLDGKITVTSTTNSCLLYTSPSPRDLSTSRMPSSA